LDNATDIRARIEAKRKALDEAKAAQEVKDLLALEAAYEEHGYDSVATLVVPRYIADLPTMVLVKAAPADFVKLHRDRCIKGAKKGVVDPMVAVRAASEVGRACIVYPDKDTVDAMREHFPSLHSEAGQVALELSRMREQEEGNE
jgi:hypothetical protein